MSNFLQPRRLLRIVKSLNELPDDVLILILHHMPMKEAARFSVLSRRWEKLWTSHPCLVFDGSNTLSNIDYSSKEILESEHIKYIDLVNNILESHHIRAIDEFIVRFDLDERYQSEVDEWMRFAFGKEVKRFELDLSSCQRMLRNFSYELCSWTLRFQSPISLTSLVLKRVNVSGEILENIISNCPFLEGLCVKGSRSLVHLKVAGPSLCLTYLEITRCGSMKSLELHVPDLLSLSYSGPYINIHFIKVPNLVELCVGGTYVVTSVQRYKLPLVPTFASQLQKLVLTLLSRVYLKRIYNLGYTELSQLEQLEVRVRAYDDDSLLCLCMLIHFSPSLNRLSLELKWSKSLMKREVKKIKAPHHNLKVVEISGFVGQRVDTEFCMYLIENAVMLEKMTIDPFNKYYYKGYENHKPERIREAREQAEHLKSKYGLEDKLVIL